MTKKIGPDLEEEIRACVQNICTEVGDTVVAKQLMGPVKVWELTDEGRFKPREETKLALLLNDLDVFPCVKDCVKSATSDPVLGPQLGNLVGVDQGWRSRLDFNYILRELLAAMLNGEGSLNFDADRYEETWGSIKSYICATEFDQVTIAPLPNFGGPFPIEISDSIQIDQLTNEEVTRCASTRILEHWVPGIEEIDHAHAVGIRCVKQCKKVVGEPAETAEPSGSSVELPFGSPATMVDDVLAALRLFKEGTVTCPGEISWHEAWFIREATNYGKRAAPLAHYNSYELGADEVPDFQELCADFANPDLQEKQRRFLIMALRRFRIAADRNQLEDRIVDLMIAAESLFLSDAGKAELRFKLALRASLYIESPRYSQRDVFQLMLKAYDVRSDIVHGEEVKQTKLPDKPEATLQEFVSAVEDAMRLSIRKALADPLIGSKGYWEDLMLGS